MTVGSLGSPTQCRTEVGTHTEQYDCGMAMIDEDVRTIDGIALSPKTELTMPLPPTFASVEEERAHRKAKLAGALRIFGRLGFGEGVAGHITVRDPEFPDLFWVNPFGTASATSSRAT